MTTPYAFGIDLGGSVLKGVAVDTVGHVLHREDYAHFEATSVSADTQPPIWAVKTVELLKRVGERHGQAPRWVGLAAPGLAARGGRAIGFMPGRMTGLEGFDWTAFLGLGHMVPVLNDAQAALIGETWLGAGKGLRNVILLTLGTGVGGAIIADGRLLKGHIGRTGHLGHLCLDPRGKPGITRIPGSLEDAIGECTLPDRTGGRFRTSRELVQAHLNGDLGASEAWLESIHALACAVASLVNILDPEAVIIGGGIARAGAALFEPLQQSLDEVEWRPGGAKVKLLPAELGEFAGALGAARNAMLEEREAT